MGAIEVWVTRFGYDCSGAENADPGGRDMSAAVRVALGRDTSWQDIGQIRRPWSLTTMFLELGAYPRQTVLGLHAHQDETALAAALPYVVGYAAHVFEIRPVEVKA